MIPKTLKTEIFFFDTYSLIEIYKGSANYEKYKKDVKIILTKLNLMEYALFLIREGKENEIDEAFENLRSFNVDYTDNILIEAARMKIKYSKEMLSYIDCIGYLLAKKFNVKFLTGDDKFKDKENVEFVR